MMLRRKAAVWLLLFSLLAPGAAAQQPAPTPTPAAQTPPAPSADPVERIKEEGLKRSQVMETLSYLTEVIGPRLTGSPAMKRANEWTRDRLASWGLQNAKLEAWGPFGRGWMLRRFSAEVVEPQAFPLVAYPKAWSPGTDGPLTGEVVVVEASTEEELVRKYKGKLRGAVVLVGQVRETKARFEPVASRLTEKQLLELANAPDPATLPRRPAPRPTPPEEIARARFNNRKTQFYYEEGVALLVDSSRGGDGGTLQFVQSASVPQPLDPPPGAAAARPWQRDAPRLIPQISLSNDHYNRVARMIQKGERVRMTVNLAVEFNEDDLMSYNTVAEIPGTDLKDEVVMLGAHLDSWHTGTGATDNAAGVAVMMEAVRILQALSLRPRRTVRIALWSGEEQGLLGSRAYVREHFGPVAPAPGAPPPQPAVFKPEHEKFNVYYNMDSGTGRVRGIYLQGNEALRPIFREWLAPLRELSMDTITIANAGGSDFLAFDAAGLPGLDFLQDEIEYTPRTWHSNEDTLDRILPDDVKQAAVVVAAFVYNSAMTDRRLPRKAPRPAR